jgi:D-alanyl-D-alanine carboxypeptidase
MECVKLLLLLAGLLQGAPGSTGPEAAGPEAAAAEALAAIHQRTGVPGLTLGVVLPDGRSFGIAAGAADERSGAPMTAASRMLSGSIGKTYFAAWILRHVERGTVELDAPIARWVGDTDWYPRLPNAEQLTLRHLMRHQSGIPDHLEDRAFLRRAFAAGDQDWSAAPRFAGILDREPLFEAGSDFRYSDTNYLVAARVVEAAAGEEAYAAIRAELLAPLGLTDTMPSDRRDLPGLVTGHPWLMREVIGAPERTLDEDGRFWCDPNLEWAGGGFCSTAGDLARWGHALYAGEVLGDEVRAEMRRGVPANLNPGDRYGLALQQWDAGEELGPGEGHGGWFPGYLSQLSHFPELGLTLALQVDTDDVRKAGDLRVLTHELARALLPALAPAEDPEHPPTSAYELRRMRGWPVRVSRGLLEDEDLTARTLDELDHQLHLVERAVPAAALPALKEVEVWVEDGARRAGMCFHPSEAWLRQNGFNPDKAGAVELTTPENFLAWVGHQQWMVLHELAHAYHFRVLDAERPQAAAAVRAAFEAARDSGRYEQVLVWDGKRARHYAMNNEREYFAELSEAWFGVNDFYPFVRAELLEHDPEGAAAVAAAWEGR